jgi:hypothetical protein
MDALSLAQLRNFIAPGPERLAVEVLLGALVLIVLSIYVRGPIGTFFRFVVFVGAMAVIIGGTGILMNSVSLAGPPNPARRLQRFLTVDWAATSEKGDGAAACVEPAQLAAREPAETEHHERRHPRRTAAHAEAATPAATPAPSAGEEDDYPELVRNAYPGIPPARLMQVVATTVSGLPGWQVVSSDPATLTINAVYHTRVLGLTDDVRIVVTPRSEVDICSRSRFGQVKTQTPLDLWHGDFGANIGHIKELYLALGPATNEAYRQVEIEQTAQQHGVKSPKP